MQTGKVAMKSRPVVLEPGDQYVLDVTFGSGYRIFGTVKGLPPSPMRMITLRRPGGPAPEELKPIDMAAAFEASKYQVGMGMVRPDDKYEISDIEPGTYIIEISKMPAHPTDLEAYKSMDRTPHYRHEIVLEKEDVEHNNEIR